MNRQFTTSLLSLIPIVQHGALMADIAIDPSEVVPSNEPAAASGSGWTTIAGCGFVLFAIALVILRRQRNRMAETKDPAGPSTSTDRSSRTNLT